MSKTDKAYRAFHTALLLSIAGAVLEANWRDGLFIFGGAVMFYGIAVFLFLSGRGEK